MFGRQQRFSWLATLKIIIILVFAFYITYNLHHNYIYPLHGDEWVHWASSEAILQANSATFTDPFLGESTLGPTSNLETGFHLFLGIYRLVTDISWLDIFKYFPSIIFLIAVLMVYVLAEREGFGFEAALFTCLIPTTVGILGPALLVPVAMGLLFIPMSLYIAFNLESWPSYLALCIINLFLLSMHPPSAVIMFTLFIPYVLFNTRSNFKHSLGITLALAIPLLVSFAWIFDRLVHEVSTLFSFQYYGTSVSIPSIIQTYGYIPIALSFLGIVFLLIKGGKKNYGLVFSLLSLSALLVIFIRFHYGVPILYERGLLYLMLMLAILAGAGLAWVRILRLPIKSTNAVKLFVARNAGAILFLIVICIALVIGIPSRQQAYYNQFIDDEDYRAFIWIRDNLDDQYKKAILDPWKATAFTAITQKNIYTRIHAYIKDSDKIAYSFLEDGCTDTSFLKENKISIIYGQCNCENIDLVELRENVYVLIKTETD